MESGNEGNASLETLVARIDERTKNTATQVKKINDHLETNYVTQKEFAPVQKLVYGLVGVVMLSVIGGILALIFRSPPQ